MNDPLDRFAGYSVSRCHAMTAQDRDEAIYMSVVGAMLCIYLGVVIALL